MPVTTLYLCIVARLDGLVDGHGEAELDESTAGVVDTRFLDQDVTHMAVIPITGSHRALNGMFPVTVKPSMSSVNFVTSNAFYIRNL